MGELGVLSEVLHQCVDDRRDWNLSGSSHMSKGNTGNSARDRSRNVKKNQILLLY